MRDVLAPVRRQPQHLAVSLEHLLQPADFTWLLDACVDRVRIVSPESADPFEPDGEGPRLDAFERQSNLARQTLVDVADESERDVIIRRLDPASSPHAALHEIELECDVLGNF